MDAKRRHDLGNLLAALGARAALRRLRDAETGGEAPRPRPRRERLVLVVEDEPAIRELVQIGLEQRGWTTVAAAHAEEALGIAAAYGDVDVLVTDLAMPRMSGHALVERLRRRVPRLRVVFVSGGDPDGLKLDDVTAHVRKPFSLDELDQTMRVLLAEA